MRTIRTTAMRHIGFLLLSLLLGLALTACGALSESPLDGGSTADTTSLWDTSAGDLYVEPDGTTSSSDATADVSAEDSTPAPDVVTSADVVVTVDLVSAPHPPIRIVLPISTAVDKPTFEAFVRAKDNLKWLLEFSTAKQDAQEPRLVLQLSGEIAMLLAGKLPPTFSVEPAVFAGQVKEANKLLQSWLDASHELSSEIPATVFDQGKSLWTPLDISETPDPCVSMDSISEPTTAAMLLNWQSHISAIDGLIDQLLAAGTSNPTLVLNLVRATLPFDAENRYLMLSGQLSYGELALTHGFGADLSSSGLCFERLFGHSPWDPWRASSTQLLKNDPSSPLLVLPQLGILGGSESPVAEHSLDAVRRQFVQQVLERNYQIDAKLPPRTWFFAIGARLGELGAPDSNVATLPRREQWKELIEWLNAHFVDQPYVEGVSVARYGSLREVLANEKTPTPTPAPTTVGDTRFSYDLKYANFEADPKLYPYHLAGLSRALINSHFTSFVDELPGTSRGAVFEVCPDARRGEAQCYWRAENEIGTQGCFSTPLHDALTPDAQLRCATRKIVVLWSSGTEELVDLSKTKLYVLPESARDGLGDHPLSVPVTAVPVSSNPTILQLKTD
ncbi:MAG: hypothetical protein KC609_21330 [Myxococcales bacterium]|nr:hypothetical protein [Myxococcales bacterium]